MVNHRTVNGGLPGLVQRLSRMASDKEILVGIPSEKASRQNETINNAELLYIHTNGVRRKSMRDEMAQEMSGGASYSRAYEMYIMSHGSPLWQVPPRPVLEPAIEEHKDKIAAQYAQVAKWAALGNSAKSDQAVIRTGELAVGYCRGWFTNPKNNWPPNAASTVAQKGSDKPLIDTGNLRKSITWVVR